MAASHAMADYAQCRIAEIQQMIDDLQHDIDTCEDQDDPQGKFRADTQAHIDRWQAAIESYRGPMYRAPAQDQ